MIVRGIDINGDWLFGKGKNDYRSGKAAIAQNIKTRLQSFLNDCFFAKSAGIDWFNLLGSKNKIALKLSISSTILNTSLVTGINQVSITLDAQRKFTIKYSVQTALSTSLQGIFTYDVGTLG